MGVEAPVIYFGAEKERSNGINVSFRPPAFLLFDRWIHRSAVSTIDICQ